MAIFKRVSIQVLFLIFGVSLSPTYAQHSYVNVIQLPLFQSPSNAGAKNTTRVFWNYSQAQDTSQRNKNLIAGIDGFSTKFKMGYGFFVEHRISNRILKDTVFDPSINFPEYDPKNVSLPNLHQDTKISFSLSPKYNFQWRHRPTTHTFSPSLELTYDRYRATIFDNFLRTYSLVELEDTSYLVQDSVFFTKNKVISNVLGIGIGLKVAFPNTSILFSSNLHQDFSKEDFNLNFKSNLTENSNGIQNYPLKRNFTFLRNRFCINQSLNKKENSDWNIFTCMYLEWIKYFGYQPIKLAYYQFASSTEKLRFEKKNYINYSASVYGRFKKGLLGVSTANIGDKFMLSVNAGFQTKTSRTLVSYCPKVGERKQQIFEICQNLYF
jgi:hypothetical protein